MRSPKLSLKLAKLRAATAGLTAPGLAQAGEDRFAAYTNQPRPGPSEPTGSVKTSPSAGRSHRSEAETNRRRQAPGNSLAAGARGACLAPAQEGRDVQVLGIE